MLLLDTWLLGSGFSGNANLTSFVHGETCSFGLDGEGFVTVGCCVSFELEGKEREKTPKKEVECGLEGTPR